MGKPLPADSDRAEDDSSAGFNMPNRLEGQTPECVSIWSFRCQIAGFLRQQTPGSTIE